VGVVGNDEGMEERGGEGVLWSPSTCDLDAKKRGFHEARQWHSIYIYITLPFPVAPRSLPCIS